MDNSTKLTLIGIGISVISFFVATYIGYRQIQIAKEQKATKDEIDALKIKITTIENNNINVTGSGPRAISGNILGGSISGNTL